MSTRLLRAELLRLRKSRALMVWSAILTVGPMLLLFLLTEAFHLHDPASVDPAGGADSFEGAIDLLVAIGGIAAVLIGTSAGTSDLSSGVFRDLVVTGTPRLRLFAVRVPGALIVWTALVAVAFGLAALFSIVLADGKPTPSAADIGLYGLWVLLATGLVVTTAVGLSSLIGSRGITIGLLLGWNFVLQPVLASLPVLGRARALFPDAAMASLRPWIDVQLEPAGVSMSIAAAGVVLAVWLGAPLAAGAWRTVRRDA